MFRPRVSFGSKKTACRPVWTAVVLILSSCAGCVDDSGLPLPVEQSARQGTDARRLVARLVHISDTHLVDTLSPARFPSADALVSAAWRPQEAYATQLLDGIVRAINGLHAAGQGVDFVVHTGDACDNAQSNELRWLLAILDGGRVEPLSGPDDRPEASRPPPELDPYHPFDAVGLYRHGVHGEKPSIPWYIVRGNHDAYSLGVFPILEGRDARRTAPLPLDGRPGWLFPVRLDPEAWFAYGAVTPARPEPPDGPTPPRFVWPNPQRRFLSPADYVQILAGSKTDPAGHGPGASAGGVTWYSARPVTGLRLVGLDTTRAVGIRPAAVHSEGALTRGQLDFLKAELAAAVAADEWVIVLTHHPSGSLSPLWGSEVSPEELRAALRSCPKVLLHLCGHTHRHRVRDQGGYLEIETASTLDWPQEGRLIELWQDASTGEVVITYQVFSHLDNALISAPNDPLVEMREIAYELARQDAGMSGRRKSIVPDDDSAPVLLPERAGTVRLARGADIR